jgi:hypothetical protein
VADHKPRRKQDGVVPTVPDATFTMSTPMDEDRNIANTGVTKIVVLAGVVDTTGKLVPTSTAITESTSPALTQAVCAAAVQMSFDPAVLGGQKVPALYKERFKFVQSHLDINAPRGSRN